MNVAELHEINLRIGRREYRIQTALDDETLKRIVALTSEISGGIGPNVEQEHLLALTCLQLAYSLQKISGLLTPVVSTLDSTKPLDLDLDSDESDFEIKT